MKKNLYSKEEIKSQLVFACINNNPKSFIPYLLSPNVFTDMPNKTRFYSFFKMIVNCAAKNAIGNLILKIEQPDWLTDKNIVQYNFYDVIHKYSRISIEIKEDKHKLNIDTQPF
jgi:hypothetical protein